MSIQKKIKNTVYNLFEKAKTLRKDLIKRQEKEKEMEQLKLEKIKKRAPVEEKTDRRVVEFSLLSVVKATLLVLLLISLLDFIVYIKEPLYVLGMSFFLAAIFDPFVDSLERMGVARGIGIIIVYIVVVGIFVVLILSLVPILFKQVTDIASNIGNYINNFLQTGDYPFAIHVQPFVDQFSNYIQQEQIIGTIQETLTQVGTALRDIAGNAFGTIVGLFSDLFNMVLVFVVTFFILIDKAAIKSFFISLFPQKNSVYISDKIHVIQSKLGEWMRGQILLCLSIGACTYVGLSILGVPYALTLSLVAGITELIPYVGPIIAYMAALPIAFNQSPWLALWVTVLYIIIQQLENNVLVPLIMRKAVGLSPIAVMLAMLIGAQLFGIVGMIIAVPVAATLAIFIDDYASKNDRHS